MLRERLGQMRKTPTWLVSSLLFVIAPIGVSTVPTSLREIGLIDTITYTIRTYPCGWQISL